ncbi:MAG: type II secretion system F family protein [Phycisphaeraceae bacterium]
MILRVLGILIAAVFWMIAGAVALAFILAAAAGADLVLGSIVGFAVPFFGLILLIILGRVAYRMRRQRAGFIVQYLEQILRLNLPVVPMLEAAGRSESVGMAKRLRRIQAGLGAGRSVAVSLDAALPELAPRHASAFLAAERIGRLPNVLTSWVQRERREALVRHEPDVIFSWAYAVVVVIFTAFVLGGMGMLILPMYEEIFHDFAVPVPWITRATLEAGASLGPAMMLASLLVAIAVAGRAVWALFRGPGRGSAVGFAPIGQLLWRVPILHGVLRDRGMADACELAAEGLRAGHPLPRVFAEVGSVRLNPVLRRRFVRLADALEAGRPLPDAAASAGLPRLAVQLLGTGDATSDPAPVLAFLHRYYRYRLSRAAELMRATVLPAVVFALALVVGWIVLSLFYPLVTLMGSDTLHTQGWL